MWQNVKIWHFSLCCLSETVYNSANVDRRMFQAASAPFFCLCSVFDVLWPQIRNWGHHKWYRSSFRHLYNVRQKKEPLFSPLLLRKTWKMIGLKTSSPRLSGPTVIPCMCKHQSHAAKTNWNSLSFWWPDFVLKKEWFSRPWSCISWQKATWVWHLPRHPSMAEGVLSFPGDIGREWVGALLAPGCPDSWPVEVLFDL